MTKQDTQKELSFNEKYLRNSGKDLVWNQEFLKKTPNTQVNIILESLQKEREQAIQATREETVKGIRNESKRWESNFLHDLEPSMSASGLLVLRDFLDSLTHKQKRKMKMEYIPLKTPPVIDFGWVDKEIIRVSCVPKQRHIGVLTALDFRNAFKKAIEELSNPSVQKKEGDK